MKALIDKLERNKILSIEEFTELLDGFDEETSIYLFERSRKKAKTYFGNKIYTRGLIEFTNYCKSDCYYCGIRRSNLNLERYRLSKDDILSCCRQGYVLGFRTFVLQGGEDMSYKDEDIVRIVSEIKNEFNDCAVTLSFGEKNYDSYEKYFKAGADRYLLRHETSNSNHYALLHPKVQTAENRKQCLYSLKKIGYQVGTGFMVGSPFQTSSNIAEDLIFIKELEPEMVGIGPFIPHHATPFSGFPKGSLSLTLFLIGLIRLMIPNALIPATTALGTIDGSGREKGILAGANVVMPNLSPVNVRKKYSLYDNKICTGEEAAECRLCLQNRMKNIGYELIVHRGDFVPINNK